MKKQTKNILLSIFVLSITAVPVFFGGRFLQSALLPQATITLNDDSLQISAVSSSGEILPEETSTYCPPACTIPYLPKDLSETHPDRYGLLLLLAAHILPERETQTIEPDSVMTRGEAASIIAKTFSLQTSGKSISNPFTDLTRSNTYYDAILTLYEQKLLSGYTDHTFKPKNTISRGEIIKILASAEFSSEEIQASFSDWKKQHPDYTYVYFKDVPANAWFAPYLYKLVENNIVETSSQDFEISREITKGELATLLSHVIQKENFQYKNN